VDKSNKILLSLGRSERCPAYCKISRMAEGGNGEAQ